MLLCGAQLGLDSSHSRDSRGAFERGQMVFEGASFGVVRTCGEHDPKRLKAILVAPLEPSCMRCAFK